jgi:O-methyltransferase involved in polyketide biosynthesis
MVVAEGLLPYLREAEALDLLRRLTARLASGRLAFDGYSRLGLRLLGLYPPIRATGAGLHWGIDDPHELEAQVPRLRFVMEAIAFDPADIARFSLSGRMLLQIWQQFPWLRRVGRLLRYDF